MNEDMNQDFTLRCRKAYALLEIDAARGFEEFLALSNEGSPDSMLQLAYCYRNGTGTAINYELAEIWFSKASETGQKNVKTLAEDNLFWLRMRDVSLFKEKEPRRAFEEYSKLSDEGHPAAMLQLAWCYEKGIGTTNEIQLAEIWYRRAFETGPERVKKRAIYHLGWLYLSQKAFAKAREIFLTGVEMNYSPVIYRLGRLYRRGEGVKRDLIEARALFERASKLGHLLARRDLAVLLMSGRFGVSNVPKGLILLLRSWKDILIVAYSNENDERIAK